MQVFKFGGTSVQNSENINKVITVIREALKKDRTIVVVSALSKTTDLLIEAGKLASAGNEDYRKLLKTNEERHLQTARELVPLTMQSALLSNVKKLCNELDAVLEGVFLLNELSARTKDRIISFGELLSSVIIAYAFEANEIPNQWVDSREIIRTDSTYAQAVVDFVATENAVKQIFTKSRKLLYIFPGFIGADSKGITTTLGRGGSDYTASILANCLQADILEIWTDVSGMMTADPRLVPNAKAISQLSYSEALELSHFGAKVIFPPTILPAMAKKIPILVKNIFAPDDVGTLIEEIQTSSKNQVLGLSSIGNIALLTLEGIGMIGIPGFSSRLFGALSAKKVNVILITQGSSEHSICVAVDENSADKAKLVVDAEFNYEIKAQIVEPLIIEYNLSIIALVGDNMKSHPGVSGKMFGAMGKNGINIRAIAQGSSEKNISAVITTSDIKKAMNVLHETFFETAYKQINLFIVGAGNVGKRLLAQLKQQQTYLLEKLKLNIRVVSIANSRKFCFDDEGLDLEKWEMQLSEGQSIDTVGYVEFIRSKNYRNAVFIDNTANAEVPKFYPELLKKSISVVASNKIACSSEYSNYLYLKDLAKEFNVSFLFETNVGASLPVIGTLNDLIRSGDSITRIEAVLSGTLNFVFNNYDGKKTFASVVKQAQDEGYTEPDPRLDLSGIDVMRKILILARESGLKMELSDIQNVSFMPEACMTGDIANFYKQVEKHEAHFKNLLEKAENQHCKLKFVATLENGKASVGLQHIDANHDFYKLFGKDNVVLFYTNRYAQLPLMVKGAGAGADLTASGVFADIIRAAKI